ncbi:hypothetical protein WCE41_13550 [Luteimonas sp. MJ246]|uniref:hypothetical protein n=1 Tax=Luteimonas sp. MJ174 TaxID=3129237 RepID=UPI0031B9D6B3
MPFPGHGKTVQRLFAVVIAFVPLAVMAWSLSTYMNRPETQLPPSSSAALFVALLLLTSFTYDALKTILLLEKDKFSVFWDNILKLVLCFAGYLICIALLALIPEHLNLFDAFVAIGAFLATLAFCYFAIRLFLASVQSAL